MLADLERDTVDFIDNYDGKYREPLVLPSKFPNLLVNGSDGIAVGMATDIPPHNLARGLRRPHPPHRRARTSAIDELMRDHPRPRLPDRRHHLRPAGHPRRLPHRPRQDHPPRPRRHRRGGQHAPDHHHARCRTSRRATAWPRPSASWSRTSASRASATIRDESSARNGEPVRLVIDLKRDADPHLVLNQLYQFSPLQKTVSIILLALVDGRPRTLTLKEMLRSSCATASRSSAGAPSTCCARPSGAAHVLEGQLIAISSLDEVIRICRTSPSRAEAKERLQEPGGGRRRAGAGPGRRALRRPAARDRRARRATA